MRIGIQHFDFDALDGDGQSRPRSVVPATQSEHGALREGKQQSRAVGVAILLLTVAASFCSLVWIAVQLIRPGLK